MLSGHVCPVVALPCGGVRTRGLVVFIVFNILQVIRHLILICTVLGSIQRLESNVEEVCVTLKSFSGIHGLRGTPTVFDEDYGRTGPKFIVLNLRLHFLALRASS